MVSIRGQVMEYMYMNDITQRRNRSDTLELNEWGQPSNCAISNSDVPEPTYTKSHHISFQEVMSMSFIKTLDTTPDRIQCQFKQHINLSYNPDRLLHKHLLKSTPFFPHSSLFFLHHLPSLTISTRSNLLAHANIVLSSTLQLIKATVLAES